MANVEQKCGECRWFQEETRSPQEAAQLLSQISGLPIDALGDGRVNRIVSKSGTCLAAELDQGKTKVVFSSFRCTVQDNEGNFQFTSKNTQ